MPSAHRFVGYLTYNSDLVTTWVRSRWVCDYFSFLMRFLILIGCLGLPVTALGAVYQEPAAFIKEVFEGVSPKPKLVWMTRRLSQDAEKILEHKPGFMRTRYWQAGSKTAWILREIGRTQPITIGVVIDKGGIQQIKVLAFEESRGWEIKHDFFTRQFRLAGLTDKLRLDRNIDGISGATLSVLAMKRVANLALLFARSLR